MVTQTIQFDSDSLSEIGTGAITAFLFSGTTLVATLGSITENATLKGNYTGTVADIAAGTYRLVIKFNGYTSSEPRYQVTLLLAAGTYVATDGLAIADSQTSILAALNGSDVIQVASPNVNGNLVLTQGDTYDGVTASNPKASWIVATDYTSGWTVTLTIRDADDALVYTTTGTVDSATVISVAINAPTGLEMTGMPGRWQGKFDVQLTKSTSIKTIALGKCVINEEQTRSPNV